MKKAIDISIQKPCTENYSNFKKTNLGGFCKSCAKEVIDFTKMNDKEILTFFEKNSENTCGRFYKNQLKVYQEINHKKTLKKHRLISALGFSIISLLTSNKLEAQQFKQDTIQTNPSKKIVHKKMLTHFTLKGNVSSKEDQYPLIGVSVVLQHSVIGTQTDFDGNFELKNIKEGDIISFYYLGYKAQEIVVKATQNDLKIIMEIDKNALNDIITVGKIDVKKTYKSKRSFWQRIKSIF